MGRNILVALDLTPRYGLIWGLSRQVGEGTNSVVYPSANVHEGATRGGMVVCPFPHNRCLSLARRKASLGSGGLSSPPVSASHSSGRPNTFRPAGLIIPGSQGGSQTSSTFASSTPGNSKSFSSASEAM